MKRSAKHRLRSSQRSSKQRLAVGIASLATSAVAAGYLIPVSHDASGIRTYSIDFINTAAISQTNTTIGVTETDIYYMTPDQINATMTALQGLGVTNIRVSVPWNYVEPADNQYDWSKLDAIVAAAQTRNIAVVATLASTPNWAAIPGAQIGAPYPTAAAPDPTKFADFASAMATRYSGDIAAYEIWNESNGQLFYSPVSPEGYAALLKAAYPVIKAADPNALVVGGVVGATAYDVGGFAMNAVTFITRMYAAGAKGSFDALSYHPYEWTSGIDALFGTRVFSQGGPYPFSPLNQLQAIRAAMVAAGDATTLIWATEYGQAAAAVGENGQAQYVADMLNTWKTFDFTGPVFIHTATDGGQDPTNTFGIFRLDGTLKPVAGLLEQILKGTTGPLPAARNPITAYVALVGGVVQVIFQPSVTTFSNVITLSQEFNASVNDFIVSLFNPTSTAALSSAAATVPVNALATSFRAVDPNSANPNAADPVATDPDAVDGLAASGAQGKQVEGSADLSKEEHPSTESAVKGQAVDGLTVESTEDDGTTDVSAGSPGSPTTPKGSTEKTTPTTPTGTTTTTTGTTTTTTDTTTTTSTRPQRNLPSSKGQRGVETNVGETQSRPRHLFGGRSERNVGDDATPHSSANTPEGSTSESKADSGS